LPGLVRVNPRDQEQVGAAVEEAQGRLRVGRIDRHQDHARHAGRAGPCQHVVGLRDQRGHREMAVGID
jgi:hypothetical protein